MKDIFLIYIKKYSIKMTKIKKFQEFEKTNEIFGWLATKTGEVAGVVGQKLSGKPSAFKNPGPGTKDNDLGATILLKIEGLTKDYLGKWLKKQSFDYQVEWIEKYAQPLIDSKSGQVCPHPHNTMCNCAKKRKDPQWQWPEMLKNGNLTVEEAIDWVYKSNKQHKIDFSHVYYPDSDVLFNHSNDWYYFFDTLNGKSFKIDIIKHLDSRTRSEFGEYSVFLTEKERKGTGRKSGTRFFRTTTSGWEDQSKQLKIKTFVGDEEGRSNLNLSQKMAKNIFEEAEKLFKILNKSAKGTARPPK